MDDELDHPPQWCPTCGSDEWIMDVPNEDDVFCANPVHDDAPVWYPS